MWTNFSKLGWTNFSILGWTNPRLSISVIFYWYWQISVHFVHITELQWPFTHWYVLIFPSYLSISWYQCVYILPSILLRTYLYVFIIVFIFILIRTYVYIPRVYYRVVHCDWNLKNCCVYMYIIIIILLLKNNCIFSWTQLMSH